MLRKENIFNALHDMNQIKIMKIADEMINFSFQIR